MKIFLVTNGVSPLDTGLHAGVGWRVVKAQVAPTHTAFCETMKRFAAWRCRCCQQRTIKLVELTPIDLQHRISHSLPQVSNVRGSASRRTAAAGLCAPFQGQSNKPPRRHGRAIFTFRVRRNGMLTSERLRSMPWRTRAMSQTFPSTPRGQSVMPSL